MAGSRAYDRGHRVRRAAATLTLTLALGLAGGAGCGGDDAEPTPAEVRAEQVRDAVAGAGLAPEVVDLLALAATGTDGTYRVAYELATTDGEVQRVELTQRPPDTRLEITNADSTADATFAIGGAFHQCHLDGDWSCAEIAATDPAATADGLDPAAVARLATELARGVERYDLAVEERAIADVTATCLVTRLRAGVEPAEGEASAGTLCVSAEGAVLLTERPGEVLRAVDYDADVDDSAFDLPA